MKFMLYCSLAVELLSLKKHYICAENKHIKMKKQFFVTGIDTEIGKTVVSAILTEALKADYWKPIQSGDLENSDSMKVKSLIGNSKTVIHPEAYRLNTPASPHYSAALDGVEIKLNAIQLPETDNDLIVEGAGGLMVPLNDQFLIIDLIEKLALPVVLVSKNYLGSINHTMLSIEVLKQRNIPIAGIIFNGKRTPSTEDYILKYSGLILLGRLEEEAEINPSIIEKYAKQIDTSVLNQSSLPLTTPRSF